MGINYEHPNHFPVPEFEAFFKVYRDHLNLLPGQTLHFELGRAVVAQCGTLISKVLYVKQGATKKFAILDAGFTELIRPALYQAYHLIERISARNFQQRRMMLLVLFVNHQTLLPKILC